MSRTIITVVGKDNPGILAKISSFLAAENVNILDITQTIRQDFFYMMMIVNMEGSPLAFSDFSRQIEQAGESVGVQVKCQKEEIFDKMHRI